MAWQDLVIGIGLMLLVYSVIPTIRDQYRQKKGLAPYDTSLLIATVELIFVIPFYTQEFWVSVVSCTLLAVLWYVVALQRYYYNRAIELMPKEDGFPDTLHITVT